MGPPGSGDSGGDCGSVVTAAPPFRRGGRKEDVRVHQECMRACREWPRHRARTKRKVPAPKQPAKYSNFQSGEKQERQSKSKE